MAEKFKELAGFREIYLIGDKGTVKTKDEVVSIGMDGHADALVAYGADLYRQGIIKGAVIGVVGFVAGEIIATSICTLVDKLKKKKLEKEEEPETKE